MRRTIRLAVVLASVVLLGACGSSKNNTAANTTPATTATTEATTTTLATTTTAAPAATTTTVGQNLTATPNTGLTDGQTIKLVGTGYTPGEKDLGVNECADKGNNTGAGDCDLKHLHAGADTIPDASGKVTTSFVVHKGPFGSNNIVCSAAQPCLVSVGQLVANPTEEATASITFAG
jgi:hypothetical protein